MIIATSRASFEMLNRIRMSTGTDMCVKTGTIDVSGLGDIKWDQLFSVPKDYWVQDMEETRHFLETELGQDMPPVIHKEVLEQQERVKKM